MKKSFKKEFIIGISVIVALVILFVGIDYLKGINLFKPANFYYAEYENVAGLELAAPVTVDGYKVGQVREINYNFEKPGKIKVLLALNKKLRIPADSHAKIESTLMSGAFINISLGKSKEFVPVGGTLETAVTPDLMSSLSNDVLPSVAAVIPKVDSLLLAVTRLVSDPALIQTIQRLDGISDNVLLASKGLSTTLGKDVPLLMHSAQGSMTRIDSITANLALLSAQLKELPLASTMASVNTTTDNLAQFSARLNDPNSTLGQLTGDAELYNRVNQVATDIDSLIVDIKKNPKRYISIKLL